MASDQNDSSAALPSYEALLAAEQGAEQLAHLRAEVLPGLHYGDPNNALSVGSEAPPFALSDVSGKSYTLAGLLAQGPLVMIFYRGGWCPFCNVQLRAFQLSRTRLRAMQANVVLISPQSLEQALSQAEHQALQSPLLSDVDNQVAHRYGLAFEFGPELRQRYLAQGLDLTPLLGDGRWELPMPATFVVDRQGIIRYAFVSADYSKRAEPADVLAVLQRLASSTKRRA